MNMTIFVFLNPSYSHFIKHVETYIEMCQGRFYDKGQKCENGPSLPLGSLKVIICGESIPKFQMYDEQKANSALIREKSKCHN